MASGLVVVGTTTGGTKEILREGETGLTFAPEDSVGLAEQVSRLNSHPGMGSKLAQAGRRTVREDFTLDKMVDEIENYLVDCFDRNPR
jgi:glycosyltransferase involved in cell wall biosynthesis